MPATAHSIQSLSHSETGAGMFPLKYPTAPATAISTSDGQNSRRACDRTRAMRSSRVSAPGAGVSGRPGYESG